MGLDQPVLIQIARFFGRVVTGDLGTDVLTHRSVLITVIEQMPFTLALIAAGIGWAALLGIPLGCFAAIRRGSLADRVDRRAVRQHDRGSVIRRRHLQPAVLRRRASAGFRRSVPAIAAISRDQLHHLVLPSLAVGLGWVGYLARMVRASMLEVLTENHIRMARAFGLRGADHHLPLRAEARHHPDRRAARHRRRAHDLRRRLRRDRLRPARCRAPDLRCRDHAQLSRSSSAA